MCFQHGDPSNSLSMVEATGVHRDTRLLQAKQYERIQVVISTVI
jgi:hypothetical protein